MTLGDLGGHGSLGDLDNPGNLETTAFEQVLEKFKGELKKKDKDNFKMTTLQGLQQTIGDLQKKQLTERRMQNMTRLKRFIEAMEQYGKVVEIFCNSSEFVAFVWGPMKFLLQVASSFSEAFSELLDAYQRIGENLPLLMQYESLFRNNRDMIKVLSLMYEDILEFHRRALKYFLQPMWRKLYHATWKTFKTRFSGLIENMCQHRSLVESQANLSQIEESRRAREISEANFKFLMEREDTHRYQAVKNWLRAASVENDQHYFCEIRAEYPNTGRWLLKNSEFKRWFDPQFPSIPPLLWINGIPGAGKTILTSLVVEEVRKLGHSPTVLFFYCKSGDTQRDNFVSIARGLLSQLLKQNKDLLPYLYEESSNSAEAILTSPTVAKELLDMAIGNCRSVYIILDGLDECARDERKVITQWFRKLVEELPPANAEAVRCLFVSQDDGAARKDFAGLSTITIRSDNNKADIEEYSSVWADKIKEKFKLSDERRNGIAASIPNEVAGMFLLAKLIWNNLFHQTSVEGLESELEPNKFPKEINDAYTRIFVRIFQQASPAEKGDTLMLFSWLVCAKRPLKWHEIQGAKFVHLEAQSVEWERRRFRVNPKDLCGSLVEIRSDNTVELVHLTAKFFLVDKKHVIPSVEEIKLGTLCVDYLNLPGFCGQDIEAMIPKGYYAFMDYAILYWVRHLEAGTAGVEGDEEPTKELTESIELLTESMEFFLDKHWASPAISHQVSKRNRDRLQCFKNAPFYGTLEQAIVSTRKQLTFHGKMKKEEIALDLADVLQGVRQVLEQNISRSMDSATEVEIEEMYGTNLFKCSRFSCNYFSNGFPTSDQRDQHADKHDRPFRCTVEGCPTVVFGLTTAKELEKHMKDTHGTLTDQDPEFPAEQGLEPPKQVEVESPPMEPVATRERKKKVFECPSCSKIFSRNYNLQSHLLTHSDDRPFKCIMCEKYFARQSDCKRHMSSHGGQNSFRCGGALEDGRPWGCGREFSRADTLGNHHKSKTGRECIFPLLQENQGRAREGAQQERDGPETAGPG